MFTKRKHIGREDSLPCLTAMWLEGLLSLQESSKRIEETQTIQVPLPGKHVVSGLQEIKWTNASDTVDSQIGESASQKWYILDTSCNIEPNSATTSTCQNHHTIPHSLKCLAFYLWAAGLQALWTCPKHGSKAVSWLHAVVPHSWWQPLKRYIWWIKT